jgi:hypothetical protein
MRNLSPRLLAFLLMSLFLLPGPQLIAHAQDESKEAKELRKREEELKKKEDKRKNKEEKSRVEGAKKYQSLNEFAEDLYASDHEFHARVDEEYMNLQAEQEDKAYLINTWSSHRKIKTENEFETIKALGELYANPRVQEYVNRLGQQIVPDDSDKLYCFKVIVNPIPNAVTLATGTVFISTGMISLLDNEAQLAYVLAHELGHVYKDHWRIRVMMPIAAEEYNKRQERKRAIWTAVFTAAGVGVGAAIAGEKGLLPGLASGFTVGKVVSNHYLGNISSDWNDTQENEADDFALKATLGKFFDIQEVPKLYTVMNIFAQSDNRVQLGFLGKRSRIKGRIEHAQKVLAGPLQAQYQQALQNNQIKGSGSEFNVVMADLKRDNGIWAFERDMFTLARANLMQAVMMRSDDPLATFYYGLVMKQVGRTKEELDQANKHLLKAISLDVRREIPEVQLHRGLMLMDSKDSGTQAEAIVAFKSYVTDYGRKRALRISNEELVPPDLGIIYGYLRLLGEKTWTAPTVDDVLNATASNPSTSNPQPNTIPRIVPASEKLSPTTSNQTSKP